ncbi:Txe/YoeB family addiction module toxin [Candidatus Peregrinibacteria bacterium]|nr:Txe/YoeB family addiction module toxin [Candidatus Peregrinibacteria bacterium]
MRLEFDQNAFEDLNYFMKHDRKKALKIMELLEDTLRHPFVGVGKPEPLKYEFAGCWSRRIDQEHRLVYSVVKNTIIVLACRYHY